jgi:hypothetical protein
MIGYILLVVASAGAQIASPGKLSKAHSALEGVNNCSKCHNFGEKSFRENCMDCHTEIRTRIREARGYHYYTRKLECSKCHKEHHGRNFRLVRWKPEAFDHKQTGFLLEGEHEGVDCRKCHNAENIHAPDIRKKGSSVLKQTYLGLSTDCSECHDDEHRGQLKDCASCHSPQNWKQTRFVHDRARFPLKGKHANVDCARCHPEKDDGNTRNGDTRFRQFRGLSYGACTDCHEDHHEGAYGKDCAQCHSPVGWKQLRIAEGSFDHAKTDFPRGRHSAVSCVQCHTGGDFGKFSTVDVTHCTACHRDYHTGQFAGRPEKGECEHCHSVDGFTPSLFPAAKHAETRFALRGAHEAIPCVRCHEEVEMQGGTTRRFTWDSFACVTCHQDPHAGQFVDRMRDGGCESCHDIESWHVMQFDHSETRFPLHGKHRDLLCDKCHREGQINGSTAKIFRMSDTSCSACHADEHGGQFADENGAVDCARCHESQDWKLLLFDHASMTRFPLTGKHLTLNCDRCHTESIVSGKKQVRYRPLETSCASCHSTGRTIN